jgi:hypothetical protein
MTRFYSIPISIPETGNSGMLIVRERERLRHQFMGSTCDICDSVTSKYTGKGAMALNRF